MKKILFLCLFVLVSCATEGEYRRYVSSYIGMSEDDFIAEMGVPDKRHTSKDKKFFEYRRSQYSAAAKMNLKCNTTYILSNGIIEDVTFRGNDCVRYPKLF